MAIFRWPATCQFVLCIGLSTALGLGGVRQESLPNRSIVPIPIKSEPQRLAPGSPLSTRALVARPPVIRGVGSWTLESRRHRGYVNTMALSPDGKRIATGGLDGTIRIWEIETGKLVKALVGHDSYCYGLSWSPDGNTLASGGSFDATVRLWDTRTGQPLRVFKGMKAYVSHVAWSPDGKHLVAAGGESGFVWHFDAVKDRTSNLFETGKAIYAIVWSPNGRSIAFACRSLPVQVYDLDAGRVAQTFGATGEDTYAVAWSADGKLIAVGGKATTVIWDAAAATTKQTLEGQGYSLAWSPEGKTLAAAPSSGNAILWNIETSKQEKTIPAIVVGMQWLPDGKGLVTRSLTGLYFWDPPTAKTTHAYEIGAMPPPLWFSGRPLITGLFTKTLTLWDAATGKSLHTLDHPNGVSAVAYSRDGKMLATGLTDNSIHLWDPATGKVIRKLEGHTGAVNAFAWSGDNHTLASGAADKKIRLWDVTTGKTMRTLDGAEGTITVLVWSPNGQTVASGGADQTIRLWNVATGQILRSMREASPTQSLAFSPDGKLLAVGGSEPIVHIWNTGNGQLVHKFESGGSPPNVSALAWAPNGTLLASGRGNHTLQLWDLRTGKALHHLATMAPVQRVAWTPGSSTIVSSNHERSVRFWDAVSGQLRGTLLAEDKCIVAIGADGHYRCEAPGESELVYVVLTDKGMETHSPAEFATTFKWKNSPAAVRLTGN